MQIRDNEGIGNRAGMLCLLLAVSVIPRPLTLASENRVECYLVWGLAGGGYHGQLTVSGGKILQVRPWQWEEADQLDADDPHSIRWIGYVYRGTDGLQLTLEASSTTRLHIRLDQPYALDQTIALADLNEQRPLIQRLGKRTDFLACGLGDIRQGPRQTCFLDLPSVWQLPEIGDLEPLEVATQWLQNDRPLLLELECNPPGELKADRIGAWQGKLLVRLHASQPLTGKARMLQAGHQLAATTLNGSLWLTVTPRIGTCQFQLRHPGGGSTLQFATTLIETRANQLLVNGEPFLVKGTLPRGAPPELKLNDADAAYLKSLGANTLRMRPPEQLPFLERHGFMMIASCHTGPGRFCESAGTDEQFRKDLASYTENSLPLVRAVTDNPYTLIIQLGNEQVMGPDPWLYRFRPPHPFERLDYLLAHLHNAVRPLEPMLPLGYANCAFGYIAPDFLDVYLHNTYLQHDRGWPPLAEFMALQGCDQRPYIHTEFGANQYMPQAYLGAPNSPILEKLHAWNYPCRWQRYSDAGTIGGTNYCLYDYDPAIVNRGSWDKGFTNFGILTFDRQPKLACWELWHLWRDFELQHQGPGQLAISYKRPYVARDCRLVIRCAGENGADLSADQPDLAIDLGIFKPHERRLVTLPGGSGDRICGATEWDWWIDYQTHGGLPMQAHGACTRQREAARFLQQLAGRDTYAFLCELFDAEVITAQNAAAPPSLAQLQREDGVVVVGFRKPNGTVYLTAFTRTAPAEGSYEPDVVIDTVFSGPVMRVDEMTGQPLGRETRALPHGEGTRLSQVAVPYLASQYTHRATEPIRLPVWRWEGQ